PPDGVPPQGAPVYPPPAAPAPAAPAPGAATVGGQASVSLGGAEASAGGQANETVTTEAPNANRPYRSESLKIVNSVAAAAGLFRMYSADSGAVGTFRCSLFTGYFSGSGFLCSSSAACAAPNGGPSTDSDSATHVSGDIGISATPLSF